jgi:hypothetical protein
MMKFQFGYNVHTSLQRHEITSFAINQKLSPRIYYKDEQIYKYIERLYIINQRQAYIDG